MSSVRNAWGSRGEDRAVKKEGAHALERGREGIFLPPRSGQASINFRRRPDGRVCTWGAPRASPGSVGQLPRGGHSRQMVRALCCIHTQWRMTPPPGGPRCHQASTGGREAAGNPPTLRVSCVPIWPSAAATRCSQTRRPGGGGCLHPRWGDPQRPEQRGADSGRCGRCAQRGYAVGASPARPATFDSVAANARGSAATALTEMSPGG